MTRNELKGYAEKLYNTTRFGWCECTEVTANSDIYHFSNLECDILRSYRTIVGIYSRKTGTFYAFGTYSQTTVKHIYKAVKMLNAMRITWLCVRSDKRIEQYVDGSGVFNANKLELDNLIKYDWSMEIETKWKEVK